jgi:hypothetical protein
VRLGEKFHIEFGVLIYDYSEYLKKSLNATGAILNLLRRQ